MSVFQRILQALGLASYDDESGVALPVVTVKILDSINLGLNQGETLSISQLAAKVGALDTDTVVKNIASASSDAVFARMLEPVSPADVDAFVHDAQTNDPTYEPVNFNNFLEIVCSPGFDTDPLVTALKAWTGVVEFAGRNPEMQGASVTNPGLNPYYAKQGYLSAANGVNAPAAWDKHADGIGTVLIDVEQGWFLQHEDLPTGIQLLEGINVRERDHGTKVLGILAAQNNTKGIVGLALNAGFSLASVYDRSNQTSDYVNHCVVTILRVGLAARRGDVILIEQGIPTPLSNGKTGQLPLEAFFPIPLAIRVVVAARGVVVVEAAGNGIKDATGYVGIDLDTFVDADGKHYLSRGSSAFFDSGAIMVAAGTAEKSPKRASFSNYGSRIDCCAHGEDVVTCDFEPSDRKRIRKNLYTNIDGRLPFEGTSPAAAIIAGCCLLIQDLQTRLTPKNTMTTPDGPTVLLDSFKMREILRKFTNCSPIGNVNDKIRAMPDLGTIIANEYQP